MSTIHFIIKGKVQGVFFRASAKNIADEIGVKGWIKNTPEGNVEALVTGSTVQLLQFENWCKQGPKHATVAELTTTAHPDAAFDTFSVIR